MSLIHPAVLYGLGLAAIPVILHFLLRSKPKKFLFPALRLVNVRRKNNVRRMRLRHIWLMLLRMAVIALLVFAISRPSLPAANYAFTTMESLALVGIVIAATAVYLGVMYYWERQRLPNHVLTYRRSMLRGGTGLTAFLLFLLFVLWPYQRRVAAEISAPLPDVSETLPVAGVFLFDSSMSMEYRLENKTCLDHARDIAVAHLSRLPPGSRIAVADTSNDERFPFQDDLVGAEGRIESLKTHPVSYKLDDRLRTALEMQTLDREQTFDLQSDIPADLQKDRYVREIYLFTDMAYSSWNVAAAESLRAEIERYPWVHLYVIDLSVDEPKNMSISSLDLSQQTVPFGGNLLIQASIDAFGIPQTEQTVELYLQNESGKLIKQGQRTVKIDSSSRANVTLAARTTGGPINQGELRLVTSDPLSHDNVRYFTVAVESPPRILLVAPRVEEARYLRFALAPDLYVLEQQARYDCTFLTEKSLIEDLLPNDGDLAQYDVVCLINVSSLNDAAWVRLSQYVEQAGGLAVFLGMPNRQDNGFSSVSYQGEAAAALLPGEPLADLTFQEPRFLDVRNGLNHPLLKKFGQMNRTAELTSIDVRRYWKVKPHDGASVPAVFSNPEGSPAILERGFGKGRTLMLATAVDWKDDWRQNWNDLPAHWVFVALADQMMQYLGQRTEQKYNFRAGEDVILPLDPNRPLRRFFLRKPGFEQFPVDVPEGSQILSITQADQLGHYKVVAGDQEKPSRFATGFSVNSPAAESNFTRITDLDLDELLGERYELSNDIEGLTRKVTTGRMGKEVFSLVLLIVIVAFCGEHFVANRFYDAEQAPEYAGGDSHRRG